MDSPLHLYSHPYFRTYRGTVLLFCITGLFALSLLLGLFSRLSTAVVWFLMLNLHTRNDLVNDFGGGYRDHDDLQ